MQINSIRRKTGKEIIKKIRNPRVVQLVCSSTTHLDLHSYLVLSIYMKWLWSSDAKISKVNKNCKG